MRRSRRERATGCARSASRRGGGRRLRRPPEGKTEDLRRRSRKARLGGKPEPGRIDSMPGQLLMHGAWRDVKRLCNFFYISLKSCKQLSQNRFFHFIRRFSSGFLERA